MRLNTKPKTKKDGIELEDIESILIENGLIENLEYYQDVKNRTFYLTSGISSDSVNPIIRNIFIINKEDEGIPYENRKPIIIYISTYGGYVDSGFGLIDAIESSKTPVYTVNIAYCYSMGFMIYIAGHKRFSFNNARFLLHDGSEGICDSSSKVSDYVKFSSESEKRVKQYVLEHTKITSKKYESNRRCEWYMFAGTAKDLGVVDAIIGKDCDIDGIEKYAMSIQN